MIDRRCLSHPALILLFAGFATACEVRAAENFPAPSGPIPSTWMADNGNDTYTNPLFYDEFSDPNIIRVGDEYYLTGTTMHTMPGLPVLHSRDLVNWEFVSYAVKELNLGPQYRSTIPTIHLTRFARCRPVHRHGGNFIWASPLTRWPTGCSTLNHGVPRPIAKTEPVSPGPMRSRLELMQTPMIKI